MVAYHTNTAWNCGQHQLSKQTKSTDHSKKSVEAPIYKCVLVVFQGGEGVGRRHPWSVPERCSLRPPEAGGGITAHQELEVWIVP